MERTKTKTQNKMTKQKDEKLEKILANEWVVRLESERYLTLRKGDQEILYNIKDRRIVSLYAHGN